MTKDKTPETAEETLKKCFDVVFKQHTIHDWKSFKAQSSEYTKLKEVYEIISSETSLLQKENEELKTVLAQTSDSLGFYINESKTFCTEAFNLKGRLEYQKEKAKDWFEISQSLQNVINAKQQLLDEMAGALKDTMPMPGKGYYTKVNELLTKYQNQKEGKPTSQCIDCGTALNEGEAKTFTCCDECWNKHYKKPK